MNKRERPQVLIGEHVLWLGSGSGLPKSGKVKWIGRLPEMGPDWNVGLELDNPLPYGGIDGAWGNRKLFQCRAKHGLIVPLSSVIQPPKLAKVSDDSNAGKERLQRKRTSQIDSQGKCPTESPQEEDDDDVFLSAPEDQHEFSQRRSHGLINSSTTSSEDLPHSPATPTDVAFNRRLSALGTLRPHQAISARLHLQSYLNGFHFDENQNAGWRVRENKKMMLGKSPFRRGGTDNLERQSSVCSSRSSGSKKERSSIFSIFRWFKKDRNTDSDSDSPPFPSSPVFRRVDRSVSGSVDTLFSTATVNSFSFVSPNYYKPYGGAQTPEVRISSAEPDTTSYKRRIRQREIRRLTEKNISLKEKYRLCASGTLPGSTDRINELSRAYDEIAASCSANGSSLGRKKRKAPPPPPQVNGTSSTSDDNLRTSDSHVKQHRRANSEPVKSTKGSCHVKGKRKAPPPPPFQLNLNNSSLSLRRRKRNAPPPPPEGAAVILDSDESGSAASTIDVSQVDVVSTDTLKLERGVLKPNKMERPRSAEPKFTPSSPVSPRPWYKRTNRVDQFGKSSERKKDKGRRRVEDWMLESGFPRFKINSFGEQNSNIFTKIERPEDKRKSAISILTNISELDREAAEIVQKGRAMEEAISATHDAVFYSANETSPFLVGQEQPPKKNSTRELISLFNSITNTREAVTPASLAENDGRKSHESKPDGVHQIILDEHEIRITDSPQPGPSNEQKTIAKVTIEELDAFDAERNSKAQALYEANRLNRPRSPPIPTIVEVAEGSTSSAAVTSPRHGDSLQTERVVATGSEELVWVCPRCTLENSRWKLICEACEQWRPIPCEFVKKKRKPDCSDAHALKIVEPKDGKKPLERGETGKNLTITSLLFKTNTDDVTPTITQVTQPVEEVDKPQEAVTNDKIIENLVTKTKEEGTKLNVGPANSDQTDAEGPDIPTTHETEQVRRARIAFFNKILESSNRENNLNRLQEEKENNLKINTNTSHNLLDKKESFKDIQTITEFPYEPKLTNNSLEDRQKLKDMLKEMKDSLPKRTKATKTSPLEQITETKEENPIGGVRSKVVQPTSDKQAEEKAEAYIVENKTTIEEIKIRKHPTAEKVSSSAQTSALVRQIPRSQPPTSSVREVIMPVTVTETSIKDGVLYTSVSKQFKKIGSGTFELMRPRDFATIEAIKSNDAAPTHLYANVTSGVATNKTEDFEQLTHQLTDAQGIASFRADLATEKGKNMNTMSLNKLLRRLESAIVNGQHELAASLAKELAQMKVNCSVTRHKPSKGEASSSQIQVEMYVEDKINHQGPIPIKVHPIMTVKQLKLKIEREYEIPVGVQRWILGRVLVNDESATLESLGVATDGCAIFLYLVAPEIANTREDEGAVALEVKVKEDKKANDEPKKTEEKKHENENKSNSFGTFTLGWKCPRCTLVNSPERPDCAACGSDRPKNYETPKDYNASKAEKDGTHKEKEFKDVNIHEDERDEKEREEERRRHYQKLMDLEKDDLILCTERLECPVCLIEYEPLQGVLLRECLHAFCKSCLENTVRYSDEAEVKCPFRDDNYTCDSTLLEREIKALVTTEVYEEHLAKSIALAETKIANAFHCKTPDCKGWCIYEDNVNLFKCPVCTHTNCLTCQAIHEGLNCKQFQERIHQDSDTNAESKRTKEMLQEMVERGEAMNCPTCQVILMKKWGCDWLRCSMCKTEICWITRGPRWGPNGKGDTSAGCQCGVNGIKCHPKCTYCH